MLKKSLLFLFIAVSFCSPALDYSQKSSWLIAETNRKNTVFDVFYIYPTLLKNLKEANPDPSRGKAQMRVRKFSSAQAKALAPEARIFVPAVRQLEFSRCGAALEGIRNCVIDEKSPFYPGVADTVRAFRYYLKHWNRGRPYVLIGHSQGAMDLYELLKRVPEITPGRGFAAAYLPGLPGVTAAQIRKDLGSRGITPAADEGTIGTVIVWNTLTEACKDSPFRTAGGYGINPISWRTDDQKADASLHKGMILFDHRTLSPVLWMYRNARPQSCSAALAKDGTLNVSDVPPVAEKLYHGLFGRGCYHGGDIWLFAGNIAENIRLRISLYTMKEEFDKAVDMIKKGNAECVLLRSGKISAAERGRGVSPLLRLFDRDQKAMKDAVVVDKVIGRAAAAIAICGGARHVYGMIMSEDARSFLKENGISSSCSLEVKRILNRKRDGLCPLEQSVQGITDPQKALASLRKKIAVLMQESRKK